MFTISRNEHEEIVSLISKYCCPCTHPPEYCSEVECDVQMIYEILWEHLEKNDLKPDEERNAIGCAEEESGMGFDDKLPFRK